jgi:hypothetical protein
MFPAKQNGWLSIPLLKEPLDNKRGVLEHWSDEVLKKAFPNRFRRPFGLIYTQQSITPSLQCSLAP